MLNIGFELNFFEILKIFGSSSTKECLLDIVSFILEKWWEHVLNTFSHAQHSYSFCSNHKAEILDVIWKNFVSSKNQYFGVIVLSQNFELKWLKKFNI